jgi:hypothetical protein
MVTLNIDFRVQLNTVKGFLATFVVTLPHMLIVLTSFAVILRWFNH